MDTRRVDVLVIDDNPHDAALSLRVLLRPPLNLCAEWIADGKAALKLLGECADEALPQVVFLDLNMPGMNGTEVLQSLRRLAKLQHLPIVMFTSSNAPQDVRECYDLGANSYVVKASEPSIFTAALSKAAAYWTNCNQPCGDVM